MELEFDGGRFVSSKGELNYKEVLDDFPTAKIIRIITYNISKNTRQDALLEALRGSSADVQLITNVPSRMPEYYDSDAGRNMRNAARRNIQVYLSKLDPSNFPNGFIPFFNVHNHAKIIGTENIVYIGSANYSNESADSIETGVLIEDRAVIQQLYQEFFDTIKDKSLSYFDEGFSAFRLFILSLHAKFDHHHRKMITDLYTDYHRTKMVVSDVIFMDIDDLQNLYLDLDELESVCAAAEDTYDEKNAEYNDALESLKRRFDCLSIDWLKSVISEDGSLYALLAYDPEHEADEILQEEYSAVAYEEDLDMYVEKQWIKQQKYIGHYMMISVKKLTISLQRSKRSYPLLMCHCFYG
jgi:hypothetical protein